VAIAAGGSQGLALKKDGTLAAWGGMFSYHATVPEGLSNFVAIAAGEDFCLAIQTNSAGPITNPSPSLPKLLARP
jgi:alpha-tubulin suppressor-like RCC1 family protein